MVDMTALQAVIRENRQRQERARDLNIRAGENVFKIMSRSEWREWLTERLNGARRAMEIADINTLHLPELEAELVAKVLADNPDTVTIESVELAIEYGKDYGGTYARTDVEEEFARNAQSETVTLPGGRSVEIRCSDHSAKTFAELVEKLEKSRIERCWSEARSQNETSWTTDFNKVVEWLVKIGCEVEITRTDNGQGEPIIGFIGLKRYSGYHEWMVFVADTKEKAEEETQKALEVLLQASVKEALIVPKEEPWQKSGYWNWEMTDLGRALQSRFETLVKEHAEGLTSGNIEEKITALKSAIEAVKAEIGGEHESTKTIVEETEAETNGKIDAVDDRYFVESEIEQVREAIKNAKDYIKSAAYGEAKAACERAVEVASQLAELCNTRSQGKQEAEQARSEVSDELYNLRYGYDQFADASSEERSEADELSREIGNAFSDRRYEVVVAKAEEARGLIARVRERNAKLEEILQAEYASCPVCGAELYRGNTHYCDSEGQQALMARGEYSGFKVKVSKIGGQELISLVADYSDRYNEFEMRLEVNGQLLAEFQNAEIETEGEWREPTARERELASEISELKRELAWIEEERGRGGRVEVTFKQGQDPKGNPQLQAEGTFTGTVENRRAESGWSEYENQSAIFVCRIPCHWLEEQPKEGETWICTTAFQISMSGQKPVIVVNPQTCSDKELGVQEKIAGLEDELSRLQSAIETAKAGNGSFTEAGGRHFKCGCGCQTRVTKSGWKDYQAGQPLEIHCSICGADGVVQKADDAEEKSEGKNDGLDVEALKKAWGCK